MHCDKKKDCLIVRLTGEIDHHLVEEIKSDIDLNYEKLKAKNIIFDFTNVSFMDSSGVGLIIGRYKNALRHNGQAAVVNANTTIRRILDISGIFKIMNYYDNLQSALSSIG